MFTFVVSASVITWPKLPANPTFGVLGENVTLEWAYSLTLAAGDKFDYFVMRRREDSLDDYGEILKYGSDGKENVYDDYKGRFALAKNATPALLLTNAKASDERKYCCKVVTTNTVKQKCVNLKIIGKCLSLLSP